MKLSARTQTALIDYFSVLGQTPFIFKDERTNLGLVKRGWLAREKNRPTMAGYVLTPEGEKAALPLVLAEAEKLIERASGWKGRCFEIASVFVAKKLVPGVAVYGHFRGDIAEHTFFRKRGRPQPPFVQHGWVILTDGRILDPTRWVFEGETPFLFIGKAGHEDYDEGGNRLRTAMRPDPPTFDYDSERIFHLTKDEAPTDVFNFVEKSLGLFREFENSDYEPGMVTLEQLNWLGGRAPAWLGANAVGVYTMLAKLDLLATIPIDNLSKVKRDTGLSFEHLKPVKTLKQRYG